MKGGAAAALAGAGDAAGQAEEAGHGTTGLSDEMVPPEVGSLTVSAALGVDPAPAVGPELTADSGLVAAAEAEPTPAAAEPIADSGLGSQAQPYQVVRMQDHASERTQFALL